MNNKKKNVKRCKLYKKKYISTYDNKNLFLMWYRIQQINWNNDDDLKPIQLFVHEKYL